MSKRDRIEARESARVKLILADNLVREAEMTLLEVEPVSQSIKQHAEYIKEHLAILIRYVVEQQSKEP